MKKIILTLLSTLSIFFSLAGCNNSTANEVSIISAHNNDESNILIAYFTWADNTNVDDPESINVDISTGASVLVPGNTAIVANYIQEAVGGNLFSIQVKELYSSNYDECLDRASQEKADNARPELATTVSNMEDYDIVFLGYPNWWYSVPMAIHSFLESYDFSGKTIVPFCCHGTGGLASSIRDISADLDENVNFITNAFGVYRPNTIGCKPDVDRWLEEIGFEVD